MTEGLITRGTVIFLKEKIFNVFTEIFNVFNVLKYLVNCFKRFQRVLGILDRFF